MDEYRMFLKQYDSFVDKVFELIVKKGLSQHPKAIQCDFEEDGVSVTYFDGSYDLREGAYIPANELLN